jgi:hypothetical protein
MRAQRRLSGCVVVAILIRVALVIMAVVRVLTRSKEESIAA